MDEATKARILLEMLDRQAQMLEAQQMMLVLMGVEELEISNEPSMMQ